MHRTYLLYKFLKFFNMKYEKVCCNPLKKSKHSRHRKNIRPVSVAIYKRHSNIGLNKYICNTCRLQLKERKFTVSGEVEGVDDVSDSEMSEENVDPSEPLTVVVDKELALFHFKKCLEHLNIPFDEDKIKNTTKGGENNIFCLLQTKLFSVHNPDDHNDSKMIRHLKDNFKKCENIKSRQLQILSILPNSWSVTKIQNIFETSNRMARNAKALIANGGFLSTSKRKIRPGISQEIIIKVESFYRNDLHSRVMPGKRDYKIVSNYDGQKVKEQKRLMLCSLKELYQIFKEANPQIKIEFSKFAQLRPKECILIGGSGTHSICVCALHQNAKLLFSGGQLQILAEDNHINFPSYKHWTALSICNPSTVKCYLGQCANCPGDEHLKDTLQTALPLHVSEIITFKQWVQTDRSNLVTLCMPVDEFVDYLSDLMKKLKVHGFITSEQNKFLDQVKINLNDGECLTICDFAENYSFIVQDSVQGYYWNNSQATIHPFVTYFKNSDGEVQHISFVIISDILEHNTVAVHLFQKKLIKFLRECKNLSLNKITYFSDGCAAQYKNRKNFVNLTHHEDDFGCKAEWHFFATSHGKGPCDGIGGSLKRSAAFASLKRPLNNQIVNAKDLYIFAQTLEKINVAFCDLEEYAKEEEFLRPRFNKAVTIPGTQTLHAFLPHSKTKIVAKIFSNDVDTPQPATIKKK